MHRLLSITAIKSLLLAGLLFAGSAWAAPVGQVVNLSGPLFALGTDGVQRVLSMGSQVEPGETLVTEAKTYAQLRFIDNSVVTLRPGTQFKIEAFTFDKAEPQKDNAAFGLFKGALRKLTGLIGKRGNEDAYRLATPTATIGIRGTEFLVAFVPEGEGPVLSRVPYALPPLASLDLRWVEAAGGTVSDVPAGVLPEPLLLAQAGGGGGGQTILSVLSGFVQMSNAFGSQGFGQGQFGVAGFNLPPQPLPRNPFGDSFRPPANFQSSQNQASQAPPGETPPPPPPPPSNPGQNSGCVMR